MPSLQLAAFQLVTADNRLVWPICFGSKQCMFDVKRIHATWQLPAVQCLENGAPQNGAPVTSSRCTMP